MLEYLMGLISHLAGEEGGGISGAGIVIDLLDLQWWQTLLGLVAALGLSPAPWILGLATSRIQFTKAADAAHQREIDEKDAAHERELAARASSYEAQRAQLIEHQAAVVASHVQRYADLEATNQRNIDTAEAHRQRGEALTDALAESTEAVKRTNHILTELRRSAEEATPSG